MVHTASSLLSRSVSLFIVCALSSFASACQEDSANSSDGKQESGQQDNDSSPSNKKESKKEGSQSEDSKKKDSKKSGSDSDEPSEESSESKQEDDWFKKPGVCGEGCNILDADACGDGERCVSWNCNLDPNPSQAWDDSNCRKIGKKKLGQECKRPWESSVENHCGKGMVCWSRCRETCQGDREKPTCSNKKEACMLSNFGFVAACLPTCDPLKPDCEDTAPACIPNGHLNNAFVCAPGGREKLGKYGDPCKTLNQCAPGHYCIESRFVDHKKCKGDHCCTEYCDTKNKGESCSQEDARCVPFYGDANKAPKGYERVGICSSL